MAKLTAQEKKWQAESDARSLAEADIIRQTPGRLNLAKKAAKGMASDAKEQAKSMVKIANVKKLKRADELIGSFILKKGEDKNMIFKVQGLNKHVALVRGYRNEGDIQYIVVCTLYRPTESKKWQCLGLLSTGGTSKETIECLTFLENYPGGVFTYVSDKDFERFYKKHYFKCIDFTRTVKKEQKLNRKEEKNRC